VLNVAAYLSRALRSALSQTLADLEIIIVDESTDSTLEIAQAAAERDSRLRVVHNVQRMGLAASRNQAQGAARGTWLALLDGDDAWVPDRLERLVEAGESSGADMVSDDLFWVEPDQRTARAFLRQTYTSLLERQPPVWLSTGDLLRYRLGYLKPLIRRAFVEQHALAYDPMLQLQEDLHYFLSALIAGARWLQLPWAGYFYYQRPGSAMTEWVDRYVASRLLDKTNALVRSSLVEGSPQLRAELQRFAAEESVALRWGLMRNDMRRRQWSALSKRILREPTAMPGAFWYGLKSYALRKLSKRRPADLCLIG
jgi:succinoglycan biosynthesis protein ExoO